MALSAAQQAANLVTFNEMAALAWSGFDAEQTELARHFYRTVVLPRLQETVEFDLGVDAGKSALQTLISHALQHRQENEFNTALTEWVPTYRQLDAAAKQTALALSTQAARGIKRSFVATGVVNEQSLGSDEDIREILKDQLVQPEDIHAAGRYILPPISIASTILMANGILPYLALRHHIDAVLSQACNRDQQITLLVPVNCNDSHWLLAKIELQNGTVAAATLIDSLANDNLAVSPAFVALQQAVQPFNANARFHPIALGVQTDGIRCMDFTVQTALKEKFSDQDVIPASLAAIRNADVANLRSAVVRAITGGGNTQTQLVLDEPTKAIFSEAELTPVVDERLQAALLQSSDLQIVFDGLLAHSLKDLYQNDPTASDAVLFGKARHSAFKQLQQRYGFFAPKPAAAADVNPVNTHTLTR